jgi:hypothetical protein
MVRALRVALPLVVLVAWTPAAFGGSHFYFRFDLDRCIKGATHVVVSEGEKIDGTVEVLESWRGGLRKGDVLQLPGLAYFALRELRLIVARGDREPTHVTGSRMILFLRWKPEESDPRKGAWEAAGADIGASVAWIEGGETYVVRGVMSEWRLIGRLEMTEQMLRERVRDQAITSSKK